MKLSITLGLSGMILIISGFYFNLKPNKKTPGPSQDNMRTVKKLHKAVSDPIADLTTYRAFPNSNFPIETIEPFIFLNHHGPQVYSPNNNGLPFGPHPHKGFETLTFILKGDILHKDSHGHESVINEGGIQWMTAGSGLIHSEVSSKEFKSKGGDLEILQLWINLPARLKSTKPKYIGLQKNEIPVLIEDAGKVTVYPVSGTWNNFKAPIQSISDVHISQLTFNKGGKLNLKIDTSRTIFLYVVKGNLLVNKTPVPKLHTVEFLNDGEIIDIEASEEAIILFGHAMPNKEPIVSHGPFVMNTKEEIQEAIKEYHQGKFNAD